MATAGCSAEIPLWVIADDNASTRISTQRLIRSFGFRTEVFTSAQEFLESGCVQEIACLILEFAAARQVPIIFVSAYASDQDKKESQGGKVQSIFCVSRSLNKH